jgi:hypothetical protein
MRKIQKALRIIAYGTLFGLALFLYLFNVPQEQKTIHSADKLSNSYTINEKQAVRHSVNSAVQVFSIKQGEFSLSSLSGTYFTHADKFYVLTSAHGIIGECSLIRVSHLKEQSNCVEITFIDHKKDYAVIEVAQMITRNPIKIPRRLANPKKSFNLLDKVYYTGYPNSVGPTTWTGTIAGLGADYLILQSYAWSGASGSGVFDEKGNLIGIVMALDVGRTQYGLQILNNFVIVVPTWNVEWHQVFME